MRTSAQILADIARRHDQPLSVEAAVEAMAALRTTRRTEGIALVVGPRKPGPDVVLRSLPSRLA